MNTNDNSMLKIATLGTGCFWCTEAIFQNMEGIKTAISGYSGGHVENPSYEEVCAKQTGHAECIQVTYDPEIVSFEEILEVFWRVHNPTTPNQQGNDKGPQYQSTIFYHNEEQKNAIEKSLKEVSESGLWSDPIITDVKAFEIFYPAEDVHQNYFNRMGDRNPYCTFVVKPKVEKFKKEFKDKLKNNK